MGKLGKKARKFAKKNLQSVLRKQRKHKSMFKRKTSSVNHKDNKNSDTTSSKKHSKGKFEEFAIDVASSSNFLDNICSEDDEDFGEDGSDGEGFLSEEPDCPYISETKIQNESDHDALSEHNKEIHMKILEKKRELERLLKKDPKFSEFLERQRAELEKSKNEELYSDEEGDTNYANGVTLNDDMHVDERKILNSYTVDIWCWLIVEQPKGPALPYLLNAFHAACRYGFSSDESQLYEIPDKEVFSKVLMFILCECDGIFRKLLGVSDSCNKDSVLKLENTSEWKTVRPMMKSYLKNCLLLLNQVTDGQILVFILSRLKYSVAFFAAFPTLMKLLIKLSVHLWITGEENLALSSFFLVREIASKCGSDWYASCLMRTYKAFVRQSKFFRPGNEKRFEFLENSIVELYSLDLQKSYQQVFASLQLLAKILSEATKTMKKEELKKIHNWQYIKCVSLWVKFINCNLKEHDLQPLLSLSILVIKGIAYLFPGLRYLPLRFRCVQMLNQVSLSSGIFIPIASLVFDCLELKGSNADTTRVKAFNFSSLLKVPKHFLKSHNFQEECILSAVELLSAHFSQWSYHISFPELATIPLKLFKRLYEKLTDETHRRHIKRFIDQVQLNREFIERKRDEVSFSPNDHASIDSFLQMEKIGSNSFIQYYDSVLQKSHSRSSNHECITL